MKKSGRASSRRLQMFSATHTKNPMSTNASGSGIQPSVARGALTTPLPRRVRGPGWAWLPAFLGGRRSG